MELISVCISLSKRTQSTMNANLAQNIIFWSLSKDSNENNMYVTRRRIQDYIQERWLRNNRKNFTIPRPIDVTNDVIARYNLCEKTDKETIKSLVGRRGRSTKVQLFDYTRDMPAYNSMASDLISEYTPYPLHEPYDDNDIQSIQGFELDNSNISSDVEKPDESGYVHSFSDDETTIDNANAHGNEESVDKIFSDDNMDIDYEITPTSSNSIRNAGDELKIDELNQVIEGLKLLSNNIESNHELTGYVTPAGNVSPVSISPSNSPRSISPSVTPTQTFGNVELEQILDDIKKREAKIDTKLRTLVKRERIVSELMESMARPPGDLNEYYERKEKHIELSKEKINYRDEQVKGVTQRLKDDQNKIEEDKKMLDTRAKQLDKRQRMFSCDVDRFKKLMETAKQKLNQHESESD